MFAMLFSLMLSKFKFLLWKEVCIYEKKTFVSLFCFFSCCLIFFSYATEGDIIKGQVVCEADIDLSNIKFDIELVSASGTHFPSSVVCTDKDGNFSFVHPSVASGAYCSVFIYDDSLPKGYGSKKLAISLQSSYYAENGLVFELSEIDHLVASYSGHGGVSYSVYDKSEETLYCNVEITYEKCESFENITYDEVKNLKKLARKGRATAGTKFIDWSGYDTLDDSIDMKLSTLLSEECISLDKYYDLWLDWREDDFNGTTFMCGNPIMSFESKIRAYANETKNPQLKEKIIRILGTEDPYDQYFQSDSYESAKASDTEVIKENIQKESNSSLPLIFIIPCAVLFVIGAFSGAVIIKKRKL